MKSPALAVALLVLASGVCSAAPVNQSTVCTSPVSFLAFAGLPAPIATPPADGVVPGKIPQPVENAGCSANVQCPLPCGNWYTLSCTGSGTCSVGSLSVTCDGNTSFCSCLVGGPNPYCYCDCWEEDCGPACVQECTDPRD